jgi:hypothetical protein
MVMKAIGTAAALLACAACSPTRPLEPNVAAVVLVGTGGGVVHVHGLVKSARLTVLVFFSRHCHCLEMHEGRLRSLYGESHSRGVQWFMIDSEVGGSREGDDAEAAKRFYPFPILLDRGAKLADALGADYAAYSVVLDSEGRVRYRGGIDTDKTHLSADATPYLRNAIDDLLAGQAPRVAWGKALGCTLEKW